MVRRALSFLFAAFVLAHVAAECVGGSDELNPQPLPPSDPTGDGNDKTTSPVPGSGTSGGGGSSSSSGSSGTNASPSDAGFSSDADASSDAGGDADAAGDH